MLTQPKARLLRRSATGTSAIALATALMAGPVHGQSALPTSYNAPDPIIASGSVTVSRGVIANVETYTVNSPTAVLDFTPSDTATGGGPINFQNAGSSVTYQGTSNFTVLNRIVPVDATRAIQFNGTVNSRINTTAGGAVWFYSPGGLILGSSAVFDVGSLLVSTGDPTGGTGTISSTSAFTLNSKADSNYAVTVQPGATINATPEGSYVALVAPVVNQNGAVRVNGSAAYVAAEQANLTINQGLFDIDVVVGANGGGTPLTHGGSSGGPSSTGGTGDNHGIYMVAVPKNTAITMLVAPTGQLGFDTAASASIENGAIYLRTADIVGLKSGLAIGSRMQGVPTAPAVANITIAPNASSGLNLISSAMEVQATNQLGVVFTKQTDLAGTTSLYAGDKTTVTLTAGSKLNANGLLAISAYTAATGGVATFEALAGSEANFAVALGVTQNESGLFNRYGAGTTRAPTGGSATIRVTGGTINANGTGNLGGGASQRFTLATRGSTADGTGVSRLIVEQGGKVSATSATGDGGLRVSASPSIGVAGIPRKGGTAAITVNSGQITTDSIFIDAPGFGANASVVGGTAEIQMLASAGSINVTKSIVLNAKATATPPSAAFPNVTATGGIARIQTAATAATSTIKADSITLDAGANFDPSTETATFAGGAAIGGNAQLSVNSGGTVTTTALLSLTSAATADPGIFGGAGGAATGGTASVNATGGQLTFGSASIATTSVGGVGATGLSPTSAGGNGGKASAGAGVFLSATAAGSISGGNLTIDATADGGKGGDGAGGTGLAGSGGAATGSPININTSGGGQIKVTTVTAETRGSGGSAGAGIGGTATTAGSGTGGALSIVAGPGLIQMLDLDAPLEGFGGIGTATGSDGGDGVGGSASIFAQAGGTLRITTGEFSVNTQAQGGRNNGGGDLTGGNATAGNISIGGVGTIEALGTDLNLDASASGGDYSQATGAGKGGVARGGTIQVNTEGTLTVKGATTLFAGADGGATASLSGGAGGNAFGGQAFLATLKGDATIGGFTFLDGSAFGGSGAGASAGGIAVGGRARIATNAFSGAGTGASTLSFANAVSMNVNGTGGTSATGTGGAGYGGQAPIAGLTTVDGGIEIHTLGGAITLNKSVTMNARGDGGAGATGGLGKGGRANYIAFGGDIKAQQATFGNVSGVGGNSSAGIGAEGTGGTFVVQTQDGGFGVPVGTPASVTIADVTGTAEGRGGSGQTGGGAGIGGISFVQANATQNKISALGVITLDVEGRGGFHSGTGAGSGGLGQAGSASVSAKAGTLTLAQSVTIDSDGIGGSANSGGQGSGGEGKGGSAFYFTDGGSVTQSAGSISLLATGQGGSAGAVGAGGIGGQGLGGNASLDAFGSGTIDATSSFTSVDASGLGGGVFGTGTGSGGVGRGGTVRVASNVGSLTLRGDLNMSTRGTGGFATGAGAGGAAFGGQTQLRADKGDTTLTGRAFVSSEGTGGSAVSGTGGAATGGESRAVAFNGSMTIAGNLDLDASAFGGFSASGQGGVGNGGRPADLQNGPFDKGAFLVANNGTVDVVGTVSLISEGDGGDGATGGVGFGGLSNLVSFGGTLTAPNIVSLESSGRGGDSSGAGATGGKGTGGDIILSAAVGGFGVPNGTPSFVTVGQLLEDASGEGGSGGAGAIGGAGGRGGDGTAGRIDTIAQAGSGQLKVDDMFIFLQGLGGDGGKAGAAAALPGSAGGVGGAGGTGTGGFSNFGTVSGTDTVQNTGTATFGNISAFTSAIGGAGGDGSSGTAGGTGAPGGNGGAGGKGGDGGLGGLAIAGSAAILSRGTPVTAGTISIESSAFGGAGGAAGSGGAGGAAGSGGLAGAAGAGGALGGGGDAEGGAASMLVTNRFNRTERGSLTAISFTGSASAIGGFGGFTGFATAGQVVAQVSKADATLDTLSLSTSGDAPPAAGFESKISVDNGTLQVNDTLSMSVVGDLGLFVFNGGTLRAGSLFLDATGQLTPPPTGGTVTPGLIDVDSDFFANFGGSFITASNFDLTGSLGITASEIQTGDIASGGSVNLNSFSNLTVGTIDAADSVFVAAAGAVEAGNISAGLGDQSFAFGDVEISAQGAITLGDVTAATIDIFTDDFAVAPFGAIQTGALKAETISVQGSGAVTTGDLTTGNFYTGIDTSFDNFLIGIGGGEDVKVGNVIGLTSVGLASETGGVSAGTITVGDSVLILGKTDVFTGGITAGSGEGGGNIFISNVSVLETDPAFEGFESFDDFDSSFDPDVLGTATPVRLDGKIVLGGPVSTTRFAAASSTGFQSASINAPGRLFINSGAAIAAGGLTTGLDLALTSDATIALGDIKAGKVDLNSKHSVTTGAINASGAVNVTAGGIASFGGSVSAPTITVSSSDIAISSGGLGTSSTTALTLNAVNSQVLLGGTGGDSQYTITGTEARGLRAQRITLNTSGEVTIGALALTGSAGGSSANLFGSAARLAVQTSGGIRVNGAFALGSAASTDRVSLQSGTRLQVATDTGSIALTGESSSALGGTLELIGGTIAVASNSVLDQLASNPNFAGRDQALATGPTGSPRPEGYLQANRIELEASSLLAIQNSNTSAQFGGFSAGTGGVQIRNRSSQSSSSSPLDVIVFGRAQDSSGNFKFNQDTLALVSLSRGEGQATSVTPTSTVNGCVIGGTSCGVSSGGDDVDEEQEMIVDRIAAVVQDAIASALSSATEPDSIAALPTVRLVATIDTTPLRTEPLVIDLVTGGGNSSLWDVAVEEEERETTGGAAAPAPQGGNK